MRLRPKLAWFVGFTAVFAALVAFIFWGTWSLDLVPVMPDCPTTHHPDFVAAHLRGILSSGCFVPDDLKGFLASPYVWQELQYALALYCAALGMAYFCRGRGLSRLASCGAGLLLAFCGYWCTLFSAGHLGWFRWMIYGVFAFGLVDRAVAKGRLRHWLLLGACAAWGSFYQPDLWLLFSVFTGVYFVWRCVCARTVPWKGALIAAAAFFAIGAPSFRKALVVDLEGREKQISEGQTVGAGVADEAEKRWIFVTNWSLPPNETAEFFVRGLNGDTSCPFTLSVGMKNGSGVKPYTGALGRPKDAKEGNYRQHSLYVGWVTCLLALIGCLGCFARFGRPGAADAPTVRFFVAAAVVFWLFSLGRYCAPVYRLVYALPFGDYLRAPVKWHHLTEFCLCFLAACGIDLLARLLSRVPALAAKSVWIVGALVLVGLVDLASSAHRYCAPVSVREARRTGSTMQMTVLPRQQFQTPQVAVMVRRGQVVSIASYMGHPDYFVVGILNKTHPVKPAEVKPSMMALLLLSLLASAAVLVCCVWPVLAPLRRRRLP